MDTNFLNVNWLPIPAEYENRLKMNVHKTLKQNRLALSDFGEFIQFYKPEDRSKRRESRQLLLYCPNSSRPCESKKIDRWKSFTYNELIARDKINLPAPAVLVAEIVEQLEAALEEFRSVEEVLANSENEETL